MWNNDFRGKIWTWKGQRRTLQLARQSNQQRANQYCKTQRRGGRKGGETTSTWKRMWVEVLLRRRRRPTRKHGGWISAMTNMAFRFQTSATCGWKPTFPNPQSNP